MPAPLISLNVVTFNEAARIERCLTHVRDFVDEMVVVDQGSTDGTADIARRCGAAVIVDDHHGFGDPSRPLAEAASSGDWILALDADEEFTPDFFVALPGLLAAPMDGYELERTNRFGGQFWSTDWHLRLWRRGRVTWPVFDRPHRQWHAWPRGHVTVAALEHDKSWSEQLADDEAYERLGAGTGRFLALARERKIAGAALDAMTVDQAKALGFDCERVRSAA